jgi:hypothetical protein
VRDYIEQRSNVKKYQTVRQKMTDGNLKVATT